MKRSKLLSLTLAACASLLSACSTELETSGNPESVGAGEALVAVSLQFPQAEKPVGYAEGDVAPGVALDEEKEIRSIAFIAFTTGGAGVYLSTIPLLDDGGFTEPLTPKEGAAAGNYTAQFKIRSGDLSGKTTLVAIANFKEHGLTFNPDELTVASLKAMLTKALATDEAIEYPLLMTVAQELELVEGSTVGVEFLMERIMARVDVVNSAYNQTTPTDNFQLISARLLSAPTQATMIAEQPIVNPTYVDLKVQAVVNEVLPAEDAPEGTPVKQQLAPMYVYDNPNSEPGDATKLAATATAVQIKGIYQGKVYDKIIPFITPKKVVDGALTGNEIVPIVRNYRYVIEILSPEEGKLEFALKATDWAEGETLDVKVDREAPKLEFAEAPAGGEDWDAETQTLETFKAAGNITFSFTATGVRDNNCAVETEYDENPSGSKLATAVTVERSDLTGYAANDEAGHLSRTYTVTIKKAADGYVFPAAVKVVVFNEKAKAEVRIKYTPAFSTVVRCSDPAATFDPATGLVDLSNAALGSSGTIHIFATEGGTYGMPHGSLAKTKGTDGFYTFDKDAGGETETDPAVLKKYGPGSYFVLPYKAVTENPELAEVGMIDGMSGTAYKRIYVKCLKKAYYVSRTVSPNADNAEYSPEGGILYLAINNGDHGTIDYTVWDNVKKNPFTPTPSATYATNITSPNWVASMTTAEVGDALGAPEGNFQLVKRVIKVKLPTTIKNPSDAITFSMGIPDEPGSGISMIPVYLTGANLKEPFYRPVLVKGVWWAPVNIGQTKISAVGDPSSAGGNFYQWGRKQALKIDAPVVQGPVASAAEAGDSFIKCTDDWLITQNDQLWNSGTEEAPIKTENDPCPAGWRVPTQIEANVLIGDHALSKVSTPSITSNSMLTIKGDTDTYDDLHIPYVGIIRNTTGAMEAMGGWAQNWASKPTANRKVENLYYSGAKCSLGNDQRGQAYSVRCVQE